MTLAGFPATVLAAPGLAAHGPAAGGHVSGPIRFARYAFGPNRLGYCGPEGSTELFQQATAGGDERALRQLARDFEGA